jgi:hypothetical protein
MEIFSDLDRTGGVFGDHLFPRTRLVCSCSECNGVLITGHFVQVGEGRFIDHAPTKWCRSSHDVGPDEDFTTWAGRKLRPDKATPQKFPTSPLSSIATLFPPLSLIVSRYSSQKSETIPPIGGEFSLKRFPCID